MKKNPKILKKKWKQIEKSKKTWKTLKKKWNKIEKKCPGCDFFYFLRSTTFKWYINWFNIRWSNLTSNTWKKHTFRLFFHFFFVKSGRTNVFWGVFCLIYTFLLEKFKKYRKVWSAFFSWFYHFFSIFVTMILWFINFFYPY